MLQQCCLVLRNVKKRAFAAEHLFLEVILERPCGDQSKLSQCKMKKRTFQLNILEPKCIILPVFHATLFIMKNKKYIYLCYPDLLIF